MMQGRLYDRIRTEKARQFFIVFAAFLIVAALVSTAFIHVAYDHLNRYGEILVRHGAQRLSSDIERARGTLEDLAFVLERRRDEGAGLPQLHAEIRAWHRWFAKENPRFLGLDDIYGEINGQFVSAVDWQLPASYNLKNSPWWQAAQHAELQGQSVGYAVAYPDAPYAEIAFSAAKCLKDERGHAFGVIAFDLDMAHLAGVLHELKFMNEGYGVLLDATASRWIRARGAPPEMAEAMPPAFFVPDDLAALREALKTQPDLSAFPLHEQASGRTYIAFFSPLPSGWLLGLLVPRDTYRRQAYFILLTMTASGLCLLLLLCLAINTLYQRHLLALEQSRTDPLTGLLNRRGLRETLDYEWHLAKQLRTPLSFCMLDLDKFKPYNDTWGHPQGDTLLVALAKLLKTSLRQTDVAARFGGDEFCLVLPDTTQEEAQPLIDKLACAIAELRVPLQQGQPGQETRITASFGLASVFPCEQGSVNEMIQLADQILYEAKTSRSI
ncbi:MAG: sensor domain-containing diguanylate cyclase [Zoogloeaceae bacterium]|jgi:diguanylate cyclase (GGDEF)-like protein|nr:sensor domain-containing diguanylate cyclase [Zoogloeaceae bacterium]